MIRHPHLRTVRTSAGLASGVDVTDCTPDLRILASPHTSCLRLLDRMSNGMRTSIYRYLMYTTRAHLNLYIGTQRPIEELMIDNQPIGDVHLEHVRSKGLLRSLSTLKTLGYVMNVRMTLDFHSRQN